MLAGSAALATLSPSAACAQVAGSVLYKFAGGSDGGKLSGGLFALSGASGNATALFGADPFGGAGICTNGCGSDFMLTPPPGGQTPWTKIALYDFTGGTDGAGPSPLSIEAKTFKKSTPFYGVTSTTVYELSGGTVTTLYTYTGGGMTGNAPNAGVVQDKSGALYNSAFFGANGMGMIIKLTPLAAGRTA